MKISESLQLQAWLDPESQSFGLFLHFFLALFSTLSCLHSKAQLPLCNGSSIINFPTILSLLWYFNLKITAEEQGSLFDNIRILSLRGSDWARALLEPFTLCRVIDNFAWLAWIMCQPLGWVVVMEAGMGILWLFYNRVGRMDVPQRSRMWVCKINSCLPKVWT